MSMCTKRGNDAAQTCTVHCKICNQKRLQHSDSIGIVSNGLNSVRRKTKKKHSGKQISWNKRDEIKKS